MLPIERELVVLLAEAGEGILDALRVEVSRRLALRRSLTKGDIRTAITNLRRFVAADQESMGSAWRIRLATTATRHQHA